MTRRPLSTCNGDGGTGEEFAKLLQALIPVLPQSVAAMSSTDRAH